MLLYLLLAGAPPAAAQAKYDLGANDKEIRIGQTMPYSGPASAAGIIGKAELAYFRMVNDKGGVNGRHVTLLSVDDGFTPPRTVEQTRRLVEQDQVLAMMGSFGSATNAAVQKYLTARKVPQLFILAAGSRFNDPAHFPWTVPFVVTLRSEARVHLSHILASNPKARIAVLYQNDDFGKDYIDGVKERLGAQLSEQVVAMTSYELTDPTVDSQIIALKASGADTLLIAASPKFTTQAVRSAFDIGWRPERYITQLASSVAAVLTPAGSERSKGVLSATTAKSVSDPQWKDDSEYREWLNFMHDYFPEGDTSDQLAFGGYNYGFVFVEVLRRCGADLTRQHLVQVATDLRGLHTPMLLPGLTLNISPTDYSPLRQMRMQRFDGNQWRLFGDLIEY